jgi:hypothetical protein
MATGIQWELQMPDLVARLQLTQAFKQSGKTKRLLQEQAPGGNFISGRPSAQPEGEQVATATLP